MKKPRLATATSLREGEAKKFHFQNQGQSREGILFFWQGQWRAYENTCQHLPLPLDHGDGRFFDSEGKHLICRNHGAIFDPATGLCLRGPCQGQKLRPLAVENRDQTLVAGGVKVSDMIH